MDLAPDHRSTAPTHVAADRILLWEAPPDGSFGWQADAAVCRTLTDDGSLAASGTQLGVDPLPYRMTWSLETGPAWVTRRLAVAVDGADWSRSVELLRGEDGTWQVTAQSHGSVDLSLPGGDPAAVAGAVDCDLGRCPFTNLMPMARHDLHRTSGEQEFLMAWVSVPDLQVLPSRQRYEHVSMGPDHATVRYVGEHRDYTALLTVDAAGFVIDYPELAQRVR